MGPSKKLKSLTIEPQCSSSVGSPPPVPSFLYLFLFLSTRYYAKQH